MCFNALQQVHRRLVWVCGTANGAAHGDPARSRIQDRVQIRCVDAADREPRERDLGGDLADELKSRELVERFRPAAKGRSHAEIVRTIEHRLPGLFDRVR